MIINYHPHRGLVGETHYSQKDLSSVYHKLALHHDRCSLTAFITNEGLFQITEVPFGFPSAPPAFQNMMHTVEKNIKFPEYTVFE